MSTTMPAGLIEALGDALAQRSRIIPDDAVTFSDDGRVHIPEGMGYETVISMLQTKLEEEEELAEFPKLFNYRPWDGAVATWNVLKKRFGIAAGVKGTKGFFGRPPQMREIAIGPKQTVQVPWGKCNLPPLENAEVHVGSGRNENGLVFRIIVEAKRKYRSEIESIFAEVQKELETNSIYKGKAIIGCDEPTFLDFSEFDPSKVVYSEEVREQIEWAVWNPIRYTDEYLRDGIPLRKAVCACGPYGTGKTLLGTGTALEATEHDWTFISARIGEDDLQDVMKLARMYEPAVVFFEDVDNATSSADSNVMSEMLDVFDGITAKGGKLIVVLTTNHPERIHKGMLRPGRLDALIEIAGLDRAGVEKLIRVTVKEGVLDSGIDYDVVFEAMEDFLPAFVVEAVNRAAGVALARVGGAPRYTLQTHDLVVAANSLQPQLKVMNEAKEGIKTPDLQQALGRTVVQATEAALHGSLIEPRDEDGSLPFKIVANGAS